MNKDWLDIGVLEDYLDGKLDAKTMNRVEREALDDPFVAEALAGLSESPKRSLHSLSLLQKQLHERIAEHESVKKTSVITWQRLSIAATAAVMFVAVSIMFWMRESNHQRELAGRAKKVEVNIAPKNPAADESPAATIQAAPVVASESADVVREKEIDRAIKAAKTNSYAARVKPAKNAVLAADTAARQLNEIVVVGYSVQKKADVTGAVARVQVQPDTTPLSLNEVVLAGVAKKKEHVMDTDKFNKVSPAPVAQVQIRGVSSLPNKAPMVSNPVGGWDKLFEYINTNNSFAKDKKVGQTVELSFRIDKNGSPTDIKIIQAADDQYEQEAIRLMINGPKWEKPEKAKSRMTFKIDF